MKSQHLPMICGAALAAMSAAGASHWLSVREFSAAADAGLPMAIPAAAPASVPAPPPARIPAAAPAAPQTLPALAGGPDASQRKFFESLVAKMENMQHQNQDLLDQVAETNRDLMKLEFRVDTHSESFRPMVVSEDRMETSYDDSPGVLPPRAEPVDLPIDLPFDN